MIGIKCLINQGGLSCNYWKQSYQMINKIKKAVEEKRQFLKNKISIFFTQADKQKLSCVKQQKAEGRSMRLDKMFTRFQRSPLSNKARSNASDSVHQDDFKNKLRAHIKKTKSKLNQENTKSVPSNSYIPKLKYKRSKQNSRRSMPSVFFDQIDLSQENHYRHEKKQIKVRQILIGSPDLVQTSQEQKYSKLNDLSILMLGGRKKKIDSVMYLKKLKTKNEVSSTVITQSFMYNSTSQQESMRIRPLFLRKDLVSSMRSNTSLIRNTQRKPSSSKDPSIKKVKNLQSYRPWSATLSEYQK